MTRLKIQVRATGNLNMRQCLRLHRGPRHPFADALRLAAEMLRQPTFPESDFEQNRLGLFTSGNEHPHQSAEHRQ